MVVVTYVYTCMYFADPFVIMNLITPTSIVHVYKLAQTVSLCAVCQATLLESCSRDVECKVCFGQLLFQACM